MLKLGLVLMLAALLAGCGRDGVAQGDAAPALAATDIHGQAVELARLRGEVVVLYFWSSCCSDTLKLVERVYRENRPYGLQVVAVNRGETPATAEYAARNGITFTMIADRTGELHRTWHATGFPTVYIVDRSGIIREKTLGDRGVPYLEQLVRRQLEARRRAAASYDRLHGTR